MLSSSAAQLLFGEANKTGTGYLTRLVLPFPMVTSWSNQVVTSIECHKSVKDSLEKIFSEILAVYGLAKIKELGIDRFGGCFQYRNKVGKNSTSLSLHSWGIAVDLDPNRNLYSETSKTARFARPEYKRMIDIFYKHGWENLGVERNYDWMHFQIKSNTITSAVASAINALPGTASVKKKSLILLIALSVLAVIIYKKWVRN